MIPSPTESLRTPSRDDLGLIAIANDAGLCISLLPNGAIFAIEHVQAGRRIMVNQVLGSAIAGGMGGLYLRTGGGAPMVLPIAGAAARCRLGRAQDRFIWEGESGGLTYRTSLRLHPAKPLWFWIIEIANRGAEDLPCDALLIQDLGLGDPGFLMNNEAYASQYLDHHPARHARFGHVLMSRQNLAQNGSHPWVAHGCLDEAVAFASDFRQVTGPAHRDADGFAIPFGTRLPSERLQHEAACAALQSRPVLLAPGAVAAWTFCGLYAPDHEAASSDADLTLIADVDAPGSGKDQSSVAWVLPTRTILQDAPCAAALPLGDEELDARYPERLHIERVEGKLLSFFTPDDTCRRHVVLSDKERIMARRHGALLRSGAAMLPDEDALCLTAWMHGVFGAQLTIGNTSLHKLFSVSRDPYNITRGSGLRLMVDVGSGWQLLAVPSAFEMGFAVCRWVYRLAAATITLSALVSGDEAAVQWRLAVEGEPCRFLIFGHLVLGEQELSHAGRVEIDAAQRRFTFRPDADHIWGRTYPDAVYHLVTSTPESVDALGGDEFLHADERRRSGAYAVIRTHRTHAFVFAVVGALNDPQQAEELAGRYSATIEEAALRARSSDHWRAVTRGIRIETDDADGAALGTIFPWLVHDAMMHLTVPHGLEQYTGGAWGTRDVCQGPLELLLALEHDASAKAILRTVFAQQYEQRGDWPQWFMLEPYSSIQDKEAHGDVIVWPLKALCDYVEATGDFAILGEKVAWRREDDLAKTADMDPISVHVDKLIATICLRFVAGTRLIRYGNGDWNDSLQPVDPSLRDVMVSSWTVALLFQQLCRYAEILHRAGNSTKAGEMGALAAAMRDDFNEFLIRDATVAGYALFEAAGDRPELLLHPSDRRTGIRYSLLPMTQAILGGLFTPEQVRHHLALIRKHLAFADGIRLMDRPIAYHGGVERLFRRAESAAFFGREIGLMYVHSHLRQAEALAALGEARDMWNALLVANPIAVTERLAHAGLRQRNAYFSSSDAGFRDRYQASEEWQRVANGTIDVEGGWRIYSSGPGVYVNLVIRQAFGMRRHFGERIVKPCLPADLQDLRLAWPGRPAAGSPPR